jgi:hypothetical protein
MPTSLSIRQALMAVMMGNQPEPPERPVLRIVMEGT